MQQSGLLTHHIVQTILINAFVGRIVLCFKKTNFFNDIWLCRHLDLICTILESYICYCCIYKTQLTNCGILQQLGFHGNQSIITNLLSFSSNMFSIMTPNEAPIALLPILFLQLTLGDSRWKWRVFSNRDLSTLSECSPKSLKHESQECKYH